MLETDGGHPRSTVHKLVGEERVITDHIDLVGIRKVNHIVNSDILIEQPSVCVIVMILAVEEITAAALGVEIPKQYTKATLGKKAGQVDRSSGFSNASFDVIDGNLFQKLNLITKAPIVQIILSFLLLRECSSVIVVSKSPPDCRKASHI